MQCDRHNFSDLCMNENSRFDWLMAKDYFSNTYTCMISKFSKGKQFKLLFNHSMVKTFTSVPKKERSTFNYIK